MTNDPAKEKSALHYLNRIKKEALLTQQTIEKEVELKRSAALWHNLSASQEFYLPPAHDAHAFQLLPHQKEGIRWLQALYEHQCHGILADEMGLGKTIQLVNFFASLAAKQYLFGTYLVVVPLSTLQNWKDELERWAPFLFVTEYHGGAAERAKLRHRLRKRHIRAFQRTSSLQEKIDQLTRAAEARPCKPKRNCEGEQEETTAARVLGEIGKEVGGVVLCSYEMCMTENGALPRCLVWDALVVDEAHRLKNTKSKLLHLLETKAEARMRLIMTGTPVQNNLKELWTLLRFVAPTLSAPHSSNDTTGTDAHPEKRVHQEEVVKWLEERIREKKRPRPSVDGDEDEEEKEAAEETGAPKEDPFLASVFSVVQQILSPFLLRRTKESIGIKLPPKLDLIVPLTLTPQQKECYDTVGRADAYQSNRLMHLRKCCLHPFLCKQWETLFYFDETEATAANRLCALQKQLNMLLSYSIKLQFLDGMIPFLHQKGHRVLLFSQMTKMLDIVEEYLYLRTEIEKCQGNTATSNSGGGGDGGGMFSYVRIDGTSSREDRNHSIALFQDKSANRSIQFVHTNPIKNTENGIEMDDLIFRTPPRATADRKAAPPEAPHTVPPLHRGLDRLLQQLNVNVNASERKSKQKTKKESDDSIAHTQMGEGTVNNEVQKDEPFLFLISTRTGGAGLNLTAADTVILFDGDYNPHNDKQAVDRCHRIGQQRPVVVYRLVTAPCTCEGDVLLDIVKRKLRLEDLLLKPSRFGGSCVEDNATNQDPFLLVKMVQIEGKSRKVHVTPFDETVFQKEKTVFSYRSGDLKQLTNREALMSA